eukprot:scaffold287991_cov47-Prasinocladus_malaysianus.AAC.1
MVSPVCLSRQVSKPECGDRFYPGGFTVNNVKMPGSVMLYEGLSLLWKAPQNASALSIEDLPLLDMIKPPPGDNFSTPIHDIYVLQQSSPILSSSLAMSSVI